MTSPIHALKEAIRARLASDVGVLTLLRGQKVFADPPQHVAFPHMAFLSAVARENGTVSDDGHAIDMTLGIWCRGGGSAEGLAIADAATAALETIPAALGAHRLVNLAVLSVEPIALKDGETWRTQMRLRAVTEVV